MTFLIDLIRLGCFGSVAQSYAAQPVSLRDSLLLIKLSMQSSQQQIAELKKTVKHLTVENERLLIQRLNTEQDLKSAVAYAKVQMFEADQLIDEPCLFCQVPPEQVTAQ